MSQNNQVNANANIQRLRERRAQEARLQTTLLTHWAEMVNERGDQIEVLNTQLNAVSDRADRLYRDNVILHGLIDEAYADVDSQSRLSLRLSELVMRIIREIPGAAREDYRDEYLAAVNDFNRGEIIDLTADEEMDEEL